jgi:hypothetical protein
MDEYLKALFPALFDFENPDGCGSLDRMARRLNDEPFSVSDSTGYSGDVQQELALSETLQSLLGIHSEDASNIAAAIVVERQQKVTKASVRRLAVENIIHKFQRMPQLAKISNSTGWTKLVDAMLAYIENSVTEVRA